VAYERVKPTYLFVYVNTSVALQSKVKLSSISDILRLRQSPPVFGTPLLIAVQKFTCDLTVTGH
jgi:hypothetical protein